MLRNNPEIAVLVTDVDSRKSHDLLNIYKNKYKYEVIPCASSNFGLLRLVYGTKVYQLKTDTYENFSRDLINICRHFNTKTIVYVPASEISTLHYYDFLTKEGHYNLKHLLPSKEAFELTRNKYFFQRFCEKNDLPVPDSFEFDDVINASEADLPLVLKPRVGAGSVGLKYLKNKTDLDYLSNVFKDEVLIQKKIRSNGKIEGAFFLSHMGKNKCSFTHKRIRTFPEDGGVTVFSESTHNVEIIKVGEKVLEKLNWTGLAMIEFMYDEDEKQWKIIELNPRLWGSVLLSAFNNSGMLLNYAELSNSQKLTSSDSEVISGKMIRWYYPYEILNFFRRKISLKELLTFNRQNICYINATYGGIWQTIAFQFYMTFNMKSIKRFFQKTFFRE